MEHPVYGRIITRRKGCFQWRIYDFYDKILEGVLSYYSPHFEFSGASYYFELLFDVNDISLSFRNSSSPIVRKLNIKLGIKAKRRGEIVTRSGETDVNGDFLLSVGMVQSELKRRRWEIIPDGSLSVFCELKSPDDEESLQQIDVPTDKMRKDFKSLLDSGDLSDVTIKVQGKEFLAHKNILHARSPVFKSMFTHETLEKRSGVVVIEDCDPVSFPDFLNYLYTGSTEYICDKNVCQLYTDADKYCVEELKEECAAFMRKNLSVGNFCDIIFLAVEHNEQKLVDSATEYFRANALEITQTAKWQEFLHQHTMIGNDLFVKFLLNVRKT